MSGTMTTWEYRVVRENDGPDLEVLGREGWELVGIAGSDDTARLYFKRPGRDFRERVTLDQKRRYYALWGKDLDAEGDAVEVAPNERRAGSGAAVRR